MNRVILVILLAMLCSIDVKAQYNTNENRVWAFGTYSGLSFATGSPVSITTALVADEGCASVCDTAGNLLFYTTGSNAWNRLHTLMPSGTSFTSLLTASNSQAAVIVPMPGNAGKYYLFSSGYYPGSGYNSRIEYSIVNMMLDGGLGDISTMGIPLADSLSEKMVSVSGNNCNIWLITHRMGIPVFLAYNISPTGISGPVISTCGTLYSLEAYNAGLLKVSPDRHHIVSQSMWFGGPNTAGTELFDFDPSTGIVSNCKVLDTTYNNYGAEFSPDNTKLYTQGSIPYTSSSEICQYDISLSSSASISASKTVLTTYPNIGRRDLKLAVDNKIYVCNAFTHYLDCIAYPNVAGTGCGYITNAVNLGTGTASSGLPNTVYMPVPNFAIVNDSVNQCISAGSGITLYPPSGAWTTYLWQDGTTLPFHYVTSSGTYWTEASDGCNVTVDTYHVHLDTLPIVNLGNDTAVADGTTFILSAPHPPGTSCLWNTGSTADTIHITAAGTYWVSINNELCVASDTINVTYPNYISSPVAPVTKAIFPNPANDNLFILASGLFGNTAAISFYNIIGAQVITQKTPLLNGSLNTSQYIGTLPIGLYEIRIEDETGRKITERITINR